MILTIVKMHGQSTKRREILQTVKELNSKAVQEKGCIAATYYEDIENQDVHYILEERKTREDLERYKSSTAYNVLLGLEVLLKEPLQIQHTIQCISGKSL